VGVTATTPPMLDFSKADPKAYAEMMRNFSKFVWNASKAFIYPVQTSN
jgi:hypothetical protein